MRVKPRLVGIGVRVLVTAACLLGIWESWKIMQSDQLYWQGSTESIRAAIRLEPDCWWCYMQLARRDDKDAEELLRTSLQLNPYNGDAAIDLGLRYEADGDLGRAEKLLLQAFAVDRTYAPRWSLANFYFRHENWPSFWMWARKATEMPVVNAVYGDVGALFELCWRVTPDEKTIEENIVVDNPSVIRQYVEFLLSKDQARAAVHPALRLVHLGSPDTDRELLLILTDRVITANDAPGANALWLELVRQHWIVADSSIPNNPEFARDPLPVKFDWNLSTYNGLHSWPGPSGLVTEFSGDEPESCTIAEEVILLPPGNYKLESSYHSRNIAANTGIRWEIADIESDTALVSSPFLSSDAPAKFTLPFSIGSDHHLLRLRLVYNRQLGTPRVSGTLVVPSIRIEASPSI
jgi:hypothetical protein